MNAVIENILARKSTRAFKSQQINDNELNQILEAGRNAPSSMNRQPWHFTVIQNKELLDEIVSENKEIVLASEELKNINKWVNVPNYNNFYHAPTVILISGQEDNIWNACDCALAMENMSLAAHALNIGSCIIVSTRFLFKSAKATDYVKRLEIPQGFVPLYSLAIGYMVDENGKPAPKKEDFVNYIR